MRICQHKYDHRAREDQRSRAAPDARRQTGEPSVGRPARDRSDARREQSLKEALQDPNGQDDDQRAIEQFRGELDV
jgi:hypothetical protein